MSTFQYNTLLITGGTGSFGHAVLNRFLEALAVMLVTTCLIPILVLLFFVWLVKLILGVELPPLGVPRRSGEKIGGGEI